MTTIPAATARSACIEESCRIGLRSAGARANQTALNGALPRRLGRRLLRRVALCGGQRGRIRTRGTSLGQRLLEGRFLPPRLQSPNDAENEQDVSPVVDVDLKGLQKKGHQGGEIDLRQALIRRALEHKPQADERRDPDDQDEQQAADPSAVGERADVGVMRLEAEHQPKAKRPEAAEAIQQHRQRAHLVAKATGRALVVVLGQRGALEEKVTRLVE